MFLSPVHLQLKPWTAIFWGPSLIRLFWSTCSCLAKSFHVFPWSLGILGCSAITPTLTGPQAASLGGALPVTRFVSNRLSLLCTCPGRLKMWWGFLQCTTTSVRLELWPYLLIAQMTAPSTCSPAHLPLSDVCTPCLLQKAGSCRFILMTLCCWHHPPFLFSCGGSVFLRGEEGQTLRPCIDDRGFNNITVKNCCPLLVISSTFELLQRSTIFTNLCSTYHLDWIQEVDKWKTAYSTLQNIMSIWWCLSVSQMYGSTAVFQALVNDILSNIIFSKSLDEHVHHVQAALECLLENSLFVKAKKCEFQAPSVSFLGYIVAQGNIQMDPVKVSQSALGLFPTPASGNRGSLDSPTSIAASSAITAPALLPSLLLPPPKFHPSGLLILISVLGGVGCFQCGGGGSPITNDDHRSEAPLLHLFLTPVPCREE